MTTDSDQLEAQSLESIAAWCKDQSVQLEVMNKLHDGWLMLNVNAFDLDCAYYRIAKPRKFYRVGKDINGLVFTVTSESQEQQQELMPKFVCWLDERKYYD